MKRFVALTGGTDDLFDVNLVRYPSLVVKVFTNSMLAAQSFAIRIYRCFVR